MTDYFDHLERDLAAAVERGAHLRWYARARRRVSGWPRRARGLAVVVAGLLVAGPAIAAVGLLGSGSTVGPIGRPVASVGNGVVVPGGVDLLGLRVPDPAGGPPWGLRLTRTTRGLVCLTVGRVLDGRIGALGRDHAFGNDGLFHPFAANYVNGPQCVAPDAHGHAFQAVALYAEPASVFERGCLPPQPPLPPRAIRLLLRLRSLTHRAPIRQPSCPSGDLRDIAYGLLGPDAAAVAYRIPGGAIRTERTFGSVGAYLVVERHSARQSGTVQFSSSITSDTAIRGVAFRTGENCGVLGPQNRGRPFLGCRIHDYVAPMPRIPAAAEVRSPVSVTLVHANHYCSNNFSAVPCDHTVPHGYHRLPDAQTRHQNPLAIIRFTARVAVTSGRSAYAITISNPPYRNRGVPPDVGCAGTGQGGGTNSDLRAGQRVTRTIFVGGNCHGIAHGTVTLVITTGPGAAGPVFARPFHGQSVGRLVGRFSVRVP
jgi:hypothetical protein